MKTIKIIVCFVILLLQGCVKNDEFETPKSFCNSELVANSTFAAVKALYDGELIEIQEDLVIEGYVISSDKTGNFFGTLHFQDSPESPVEGFQIDIDLREYHLFYVIGQKLAIKLKGLYLDKNKGVFKLGGLFSGFGGAPTIGRLPATQIQHHVFISCGELKTITPQKITLEGLNDSMLNTLVQLEHVEVAPDAICQPYAIPEETTERTLRDCNKHEITLRNSGFSDFQSVILPTGSGTITGVLGKSGDDYELVIRDITDILFENPRCDGTIFSCEPPSANATIDEIKAVFSESILEIENNFIVEAIITANDASGNLSRAIYVQDETGGIRVEINQTKLSEAGYEIGKKITLSTKGLYIDSVGGELYLGAKREGKLEGISEDELFKHSYVHETQEEVLPKEVDIKTLSLNDVGRLVQINEIQFVEENTTFVVDGKNTVATLTNCFGDRLKLPTSRFADYGETTLPSGNGAITGILSFSEEGYQLLLRDLSDISEMTNNRCDVFANAQLITLEVLKNQYEGIPKLINENIKIKAVVISDKEALNISAEKIIVQDTSTGMLLSFTTNHDLALGEALEIALLETTIEEIEGIIQVKNIPIENIISRTLGSLPLSENITIAEARSGTYNCKLVTIINSEFKNLENTYEGIQIITDCESELSLFTKAEATFANELVNPNKGSITGILLGGNALQLHMRNLQDISFTQPYALCAVTETEEVFFSELADPNNNSGARFIELYNAGTIKVDLTGWKIHRYTNANTTISSTIDLTGYFIAPKTTFVIAANATEFTNVYGFAPDFAATSSGPAGSNGDDNLMLTDANGKVIDMFGIIGEDGSGTNHEFEDGRAVRKNTISKGNPTYTFDEWIIYNDTGGGGTSNAPKNAPEDFTPGIKD
ncbi:DUF5689 domain-containing protein [Leptobacterium sp. I13]|uniref:DUF5689 domain-containing protein n=1 Tax=Leptobacterium meishanense TaxID=3128904 RepID=UPI0030EC0D15